MTAVLVHADTRTLLRLKRGRRNREHRMVFLHQLILDLDDFARGRDLWMPAYNYGFFDQRYFDSRSATSQMGVLSEYFRVHHSQWRTAMPILSFSGTGPQPHLDLSVPALYPYSSASPVGRLVSEGGRQLLLGCTVQWSSLFHYAEVFESSFPLYRYEKGFSGTTVDATGTARDVEVRYAVTSLERPTNYDFARMHAAMVDAGVVRANARYPASYDVDSQGFVLEWQRLTRADPFWPLTQESRSWVQPMVESLGRGFHIRDFEAQS
jgi:aminoglycoside N3'-acetyltransferase